MKAAFSLLTRRAVFFMWIRNGEKEKGVSITPQNAGLTEEMTLLVIHSYAQVMCATFSIL
ncbi:hypothetical protein [Jeotgalibaca caeni]|uniref:hypothetical protein n=1 Tax=Jeotgalibaca caeni TaxID=3028623 RepID=UPI00237E7AB0|nr:hypothetical protein [Jeotgalibaca caeni]MDE1548504.1 hypothetical protein [Jeotgalibaca caeni]